MCVQLTLCPELVLTAAVAVTPVGSGGARLVVTPTGRPGGGCRGRPPPGAESGTGAGRRTVYGSGGGGT